MPSRSSSRPARKPAQPRRRRSAEDAKRAILDAAEARFAAHGPAALRLQDVAADVGVSHPAILHHFGSREDLIRAVIDRALAGVREDVLATLAAPDPTRIDVAALIERVFETLGGHGQARLMAWLALADESRGARREGGAFFVRETAEAVHAQRTALNAAAGRPAPPFEDTFFAILLSSLALIGDALLGDTTRASSGLTDPAAGRRFRSWLAELLVAHLAGPVEPAPAPAARPARTRKRRSC